MEIRRDYYYSAQEGSRICLPINKNRWICLANAIHRSAALLFLLASSLISEYFIHPIVRNTTATPPWTHDILFAGFPLWPSQPSVLLTFSLHSVTKQFWFAIFRGLLQHSRPSLPLPLCCYVRLWLCHDDGHASAQEATASFSSGDAWKKFLFRDDSFDEVGL